MLAEILWLSISSGLAFAQLQEPLPKLNYDMIPDFFQLPPEEHAVEPAGVAVNSKGHIYVFHGDKHPLMEFDSSGKFVRGIANSQVLKFDKYGRPLLGWGIKGTGPGSSTTPRTIAIDGDLV